MTKRPTLQEFSAEVRDDDAKTNRLVAQIVAASENYRRLRTAQPNDHAIHVARLADGGPVVPFTDIASETRQAAALCRDLNEAREKRHHDLQKVRQKARAALCKSFVPEERSVLKRAAGACVELSAALQDYQDLKDYLIVQGGLVGICLTDT